MPQGSKMDSEWSLWKWNDIPSELLVDILLRLPVKDIIRCMLACKNWLSVIKSSEFVSIHLNHFRTQDQNILIVKKNSFGLYFESENTLVEQESAPFPFPVIRQDLYILGSCMGLVLVRLRAEHAWIVFLWNPSIQKFKLIYTLRFDACVCDQSGQPLYFDAFALGFHEPSKDYRVVRIHDTPGKHLPSEVDVYSLAEDSWHWVDGTHIPTIVGHSDMAYIDGLVHWLACNETEGDDHRVILSFDFENETFKVIELPIPYGLEFGRPVLNIREVNGRLALYADFVGENKLDIWLMMEYPVVESWTRHEFYLAYGEMRIVWPMGLTKSRNCIFRSRYQWNKLKYYRVEADIIVDFGMVSPYERAVIVDFIKCLVLLDRGHAVVDLNP